MTVMTIEGRREEGRRDESEREREREGERGRAIGWRRSSLK